MVFTHESAVKTVISFVVSLSFLFAFTPSVYAEILINEFSSNSSQEWVELYNTSSETVDLSNWSIADDAQSPELLNGNITGGSFYVFEKSEGWLNNSGGDSIILKDSAGVVKDSIVYGKTGSIIGTPDFDKSAGRTPNGSSVWQNNLTWTKSTSNPEAVPSPSPSPTPTPTPTPSPSPTISPSPSPSPSPIKSPSPLPTKSPSSKLSPSPFVSEPQVGTEKGETLGIGTSISDSPSPSSDSSSDREFPLFAVSLIGGGMLLLGIASFLFFKSYKKEQNHTTEELL